VTTPVPNLTGPYSTRVPLAHRIRIADEAVGRIAAFPIEMLDAFAAPHLATMAGEIRSVETCIRETTPALLKVLFKGVSQAVDKSTRSWLLEVKRTVYNGVQPWEPPTERQQKVLESISADLALQLELENERRLKVMTLRRDFANAYDLELRRQCLALRNTTRDARFARALTLANPPLAMRWEQTTSEAPRTKRVRHLERAVLHYLLRAVGRPTPSDGWAGVARIRLGQSRYDLEVSPGVTRCVAAPDLRPFREIVEFLASSGRYLEACPLRIDPAAHLEDGSWWGIDAEGEWVQLPNNPAIEAITSVFLGNDQPRVAELIELLSVVHQKVELVQSLEQLIDAGILRSSLEFPAAPTSAWGALESVTQQLMEPEKSAWLNAVERCRIACAELAEGYERLSTTSVVQFHEDVRLAVVELCRQVGFKTDLPAQMIKLDLTVSFEIRWSAQLIEQMRKAVVEVLEFHAQVGAAEVFRGELLDQVRGGCTTLAHLVRTQTDLEGRATRAALACFKEWTMRRKSEEITVEATPGPYGTLMFILGGDPITPYFSWGRSAPDFASCRAYELLDRTTQDLAFISQLHGGGVRSVEVVGIDAANPNATIRLEDRKGFELGRHAATAAAFSKLQIEVDRNGRPWLRFPESKEDFVPTYSAPAGIGLNDPAGRFLVRLAMAHGWEFISFGVPFAAVMADIEGVGPVCVSAGDSVLGAQQWVLPAGFVRELRAKNNLEQYSMWRNAIDQACLGEWIWVGPATRPDAPRLLIRADSPLLLSVVLEVHNEDCESLVLTKAPDPQHWPVKDDCGNHYLCELAITWADPEHWSEVRR
jgi:hypothetical protein